MSERRELVEICGLLDISDTNNQTDIELLRSILAKLSASNPLGDVPDSLAFPQKSREKANLSGANDFWNELRKFNDLLKQDYSCRRHMLLNRLDCTVESFKWKGQNEQNFKTDTNEQKQSQGRSAKSPNELMHDRYEHHRTGLSSEPNVTLSLLLALRETECDNLLNRAVSTNTFDCKVSYGAPTKCRQQQESATLVNLKQIIIPDVPDRGGRTGEHREPPRETFARQYRGRGGRR